MAISDTQKVDYLWKKIGYGAAKTDTNANKKAPNEAIASPLIVRGDTIWSESDQIPGTIPTSSGDYVTVYSDALSTTIECDEDVTASTRRTWKTGLTNWIPPQFGSTYQVKVYVDDTSQSDPQTGGTQLFATGSGNDDEWYFDYSAGVLNFIGTNLPSSVTSGKSIYIVGARYTGSTGVAASGTSEETTALINDRMQVANTVLLVNDRMQVANTTLLVNDRLQVANAEALYVSLSGDTMTGDLSFGDNNKAIFGAGSDLEIYHNGSSDSYILADSSNLTILGSSYFGIGTGNLTYPTVLIDSSSPSAGEISCNLYYSYLGTESKKLETTSTGIEVSGTVKSDGGTKSDLDTPTVGTTTTLDFDKCNFILTLDQNTTFAVSNVSTNIGKTGTIVIKQDGTGGYSFTIPSEFKTPNGDTISQVTTQNSVNAINYFIVDANTILINYLGDFQ